MKDVCASTTTDTQLLVRQCVQAIVLTDMSACVQMISGSLYLVE